MILNPISDGPESAYIKVPEGAVNKLIQTKNTVYLAVYMAALSDYYDGKTNITNGYIADKLHINIIDVVNAFLYCASEGLLTVHNFTSVSDAEFDIEFIFDIKTNTKAAHFRPSYKSGEIGKRMKENSKLSQTYKIVSKILGKNLSSADIEILYSMHDYYGLSAEVIVVMIEYFAQKGKTTMRSLEKEAQKWAEKSIDTVAKANSYIKSREELLSYAGKVKRIVGANERNLTTKELEFIEKWQKELKVSTDDVKFAYETTVQNTGKLSFAYMNKILENRKNENKQTAKPKAYSSAKSRYDYDEIERKAFLNLTKKGGE